MVICTQFRKRLIVSCLTSAFFAIAFLAHATASAAGISSQVFSNWKLPLPSGSYYVIQGDYNSSTYTHHSKYPSLKCAIDIVNPSNANSIDGTPVLAPASGTITQVAEQPGLAGYYLDITHDDGMVSQYMHLKKDSFVVKKGDRVVVGQPMARIDDTGKSTEAHLHFVVYQNVQKKDCVWIDQLDGNADFRTGVTIISSNQQIGVIPDLPIPKPVPTQQPPLPNPTTSQPNQPGACTKESIESYLVGSPLSGQAAIFISKGQQYNVDPRFIIAIAYAESSLGKKTCAPYNAWGEMENGKCRNFIDWENSIDYVSWHIGQKYLPIGQDTIPEFVSKPWGSCTSHCWCASGCEHWISNVGDAYDAMGGTRDTNNLTFFACNQGVLLPTLTPTPTPIPMPVATPTLTHTGTPQNLSAPSQREPQNGGSLSSNADIWFSWNYVPNGVEYYLEYWGGPYTTLNSGWINDSAHHIGTMWPGTYYWHVKVRDVTGKESGWSETWTFTIQDTLTTTPVSTLTPTPPAQNLSAPTLRDPTDGASLPQTTDIWFSWNYTTNAVEYYLEYWGGPYTTLNSGWLNDTAYHIGTMWPGNYSWRVKARDVKGRESDWSGTRTFMIQDVLPTFTVTVAPEIGNIAPRANRNPEGIQSGNAFDGNLSTFWIDGLGHTFNLSLSWGNPSLVSRIIVWDRPQNSPDNNQINALIITLSNGMSKRFGMDSQGARCIDVTLATSQAITSLTLKADDASGNNGLSEVEIWVGPKTGGPTCSNTGSMP